MVIKCDMKQFASKILLITIVVLSLAISSLFHALTIRATSRVKAQTEDFRILVFDVWMRVDDDESVTVVETITVDFLSPRHGIFRDIPVWHTAGFKTVNTGLKLLGVTDENNQPYPYKLESEAGVLRIKIGDPYRTITGRQVYQISYQMDNLLRRDQDGQREIFWNVTGNAWPVQINRAYFKLVADGWRIKDSVCYTGETGSRAQDCQVNWLSTSELRLASSQSLPPNTGLTVAVKLQPAQAGVGKAWWQYYLRQLADQWGYWLATIPLLIMFIFWWLKGRDLAPVSGQIYYSDESGEQAVVPWQRHVLPLVYAPLQDLTPAAVGLLRDEMVDTKEMVAEILELARLGVIQIKQLTIKRRFARDKQDFLLLSTSENTWPALTEYQQYLARALFDIRFVSKSLPQLKPGLLEPKLDKDIGLSRSDVRAVLLSALKQDFYQEFGLFQKLVYQYGLAQGWFWDRPDKTRLKWAKFAGVLIALVLASEFVYGGLTNNWWPLALAGVSSGLSMYLALMMPRKTVAGFRLHRQVVGFEEWLKTGKWREEIAEKNLFLSETLPFAVVLDVVGKLVKQIKQLGMADSPELEYTGGWLSQSRGWQRFSHDLDRAVSLPRKTGSSWSGGSGFSSGSSGGGFGGGGGGSW